LIDSIKQNAGGGRAKWQSEHRSLDRDNRNDVGDDRASNCSFRSSDRGTSEALKYRAVLGPRLSHHAYLDRHPVWETGKYLGNSRRETARVTDLVSYAST